MAGSQSSRGSIVDSWWLMTSPVEFPSLMVVYLIIVTIGPRIMRNRPPIMMNKLLACYNAFQVLLSAFICVKILKLDPFVDGIIYAGCRYPTHSQDPLLLDAGWWYFFAKFTELLDTVFFVLRKKDNQITFLHVYHHVTMAVYAWSYVKFAPGGQGAVMAMLNSIVHMVMYTYYLLSGLGPRFQKYLWWKRHVTKMQLYQFIILLAYCAWTHFSPRCQFAAGFTYYICGNIIFFLFLFLKFYFKNYTIQIMDKNSKKEDENGTKKNEVHSVCFNEDGL